MRKKKQIGVCRLCGKTGNLTFEHVPPRSAFNHDAVSIIEGDDYINLFGSDRLPWDTDGIKHRIQQQGRGGYYLCESCNNNTGSWYVDEYVKFVRGVSTVLQNRPQEFDILRIKLPGIRPMPLYKAIMTMFCDINHECFGDEKLRNFLLTKESTELDFEHNRVFMYIYDGEVERSNSLAAIGCENGDIILLSEIASYPIGLVLYRDCPDGFSPQGIEITSLGSLEYDRIYDLDIEIPRLECNTFFSGDYRSKQTIEDIYSKN